MRYMYWRVPGRGNLWRRKVFNQPWSLHRVRHMRKRMSSGGYQPCWIISIIQGLTAGSVALSRFFWRHKDRIGWRTWFFWGKDRRTWEQIVVGKTREHENMFLFWRHENMRTCCCLKRQKNRRTGFLKTEEWVSVGGYGIPAIPTQTWVYKPIEWVWQGCHTLLQYLNFLLFYF